MSRSFPLFSAEEIFAAYKKLKHYFYYDNTSLFIREKIASFEKTITAENGSYDKAFMFRMRQIARSFNSMSLKDWRKQLEEEVSYRVTPKSFKKRPPTIVTNYNGEEHPQLTRVNFFIDASVEVHLVTVLWLMKVGHILSKDIEPENYAYRLELFKEDEDDDELHPVVTGLRLYQPYYIQYQAWRDKAIQQVESLLENRKNAILLSLDIKDYFHSVKINLGEILNDILLNKDYIQEEAPQIKRLFSFLEVIHDVYTAKLSHVKGLPELANKESIYRLVCCRLGCLVITT